MSGMAAGLGAKQRPRVSRSGSLPASSSASMASASSFLAFVERVIAAINKAIVNVPRDRVRLHVCWGNYEGPHDRDVPLADILPVLQQANVGGFVLPFANPRHQHEYRVLQKFPLADDQIIVAGVIDDLTGFVEHPEVVADHARDAFEAVVWAKM